MFNFLKSAKAFVTGSLHPQHAGDLEPLFENNGYAYYSFVINRFNIDEIIVRSVIIHDNSDNFTTQPSGNSGNKIACGINRKIFLKLC